MPPMSPAIALLIAALAGAGLAFQSGSNASLGRWLGHPMWALFWQFAASTVLIAILTVGLRLPSPALATTIASAPWWVWIGCVTGMFFVMAALAVAPIIGVSGLIAALVAGQMIAAIVIDHYGLVGLAVRPLTLTRGLGMVLIAAGVLLVQIKTR